MTRRIPSCHPDRMHQAKGLCGQCYMKQYDAQRQSRKEPSEYAPNYRKPPHPPRRNADCHPDRAHWAKGLCSVCYNRQRTNSVKARCHPERPHVADGLCSRCYSKRRYDSDPEVARRQANESHRRNQTKLRDALVEAYGGRCACSSCPETNSEFLTLDHINGDGKAHRMTMGSHTYADLRRRGWPKDGYRLLCWNCNAMTRGGRACPHERTRP